MFREWRETFRVYACRVTRSSTPSGTPVVLRGVGLGGWMNMENFITGYPANESAMREAVGAVLGRERADAFFERLLDRFFTRRGRGVPGGAGRELRAACRSINATSKVTRDRSNGFREVSNDFAGVIELLGAHGIYSRHRSARGARLARTSTGTPTTRRTWPRSGSTRTSWSGRRRCGSSWPSRFAGNAVGGGLQPAQRAGRPDGRRRRSVARADRRRRCARSTPTTSSSWTATRTRPTSPSFGEPVENAIYACHDYARDGMAFGGPYER